MKLDWKHLIEKDVSNVTLQLNFLHEGRKTGYLPCSATYLLMARWCESSASGQSAIMVNTH